LEFRALELALTAESFLLAPNRRNGSDAKIEELKEATLAHSYEEVRDAAVEVLSGRFQIQGGINQFGALVRAVALYFENVEKKPRQGIGAQLDAQDRELVRDVFWDLFRQGHITLGYDNSNEAWPFFRLSHTGQKALREGTPYKFMDSSTYLDMVSKAAPRIDGVTRTYLDEAVRDYYAGCFLSCSVMLGVAAENLFNRLLDVTSKSNKHAATFAGAASQRFMLTKIVEFQKAIEPLKPTLPREAREDLDTHLSAIQAVLRTHRNNTGHPTGRSMSREQTYVHLQLFAPFAKKLEQLEDALC